MGFMKNQYLLDFYKIAFLSMKQKVTGDKVNLAKPVLLLSVFDAIEDGSITGNKIMYNTVKPIYETILGKVQAEPTPLKYPFYHMRSDGFWRLEWKADAPKIPSVPSDKFMRENLDYAMFDQALWDLLQDKEIRDFYRNAISGYYKMQIENTR